jgi:CHASE3 domain sensor protein
MSDPARRWADLSLRKKGVLLLSVPLLGPLADSALLYAVSAQRQAANEQVNRSIGVRTATGDLLAVLTDAETGVRGYLATGQPVLLQPYDATLAHFSASRNELSAVATVKLRNRVALVDRLASQELAELAQLKDAGPLGASSDRVDPLLAEKATMYGIRAELRAVQTFDATGPL